MSPRRCKIDALTNAKHPAEAREMSSRFANGPVSKTSCVAANRLVEDYAAKAQHYRSWSGTGVSGFKLTFPQLGNRDANPGRNPSESCLGLRFNYTRAPHDL